METITKSVKISKPRPKKFFNPITTTPEPNVVTDIRVPNVARDVRVTEPSTLSTTTQMKQVGFSGLIGQREPMLSTSKSRSIGRQFFLRVSNTPRIRALTMPVTQAPFVHTNNNQNSLTHTNMAQNSVVHTGNVHKPVMHTSNALNSVMHTNRMHGHVMQTNHAQNPVMHTNSLLVPNINSAIPMNNVLTQNQNPIIQQVTTSPPILMQSNVPPQVVPKRKAISRHTITNTFLSRQFNPVMQLKRYLPLENLKPDPLTPGMCIKTNANYRYDISCGFLSKWIALCKDARYAKTCCKPCYINKQEATVQKMFFGV